jgi:hypothetical protein
MDPSVEMASYMAETSTSVKDHVVCLFDGQTIEFRDWKEGIELHLTANGLDSGILDNQDLGDKTKHCREIFSLLHDNEHQPDSFVQGFY